ncbi:kinase-like domain-containing protein, partial [Hyaloraphidium curvatum]
NPRTSSADYKPVRILGQGKEGQVFLARSLKDGREVAIKQINRREKGISSLFHSKEHKLEKEQSISDHVHGEVEILKRINHPHMIRLLDCYQTRDKWCLVFELATGGELHDRIYADYTPHGFNERHAAYIIATLCNALRFLHDLHICHRDMKAANVMFRGEGKSSIVLVDFGIARTLANDDRQKEMMLSTQTGTLAYIAPEIIRGKGYGKAVDCWSLGVITYELVSGVQPWLDLDGTQSLLERILTSDFDFPTEFFESVSKTAQNFILRFMQADPNKRMTMAQAMEHPWIK